jgi:hypothetical protein
MPREFLPVDAAQQVSPRALMSYAQGLGWQAMPNGRRPEIAVYHRPDSRLHQVIIPTDPTLADYGDWLNSRSDPRARCWSICCCRLPMCCVFVR